MPEKGNNIMLGQQSIGLLFDVFIGRVLLGALI